LDGLPILSDPSTTQSDVGPYPEDFEALPGPETLFDLEADQLPGFQDR
jgi:hypothetical protein